MTAVDVSLLGAGALTLTVADEKVTAYAAAEAIASRLGLADGGCHALCVATDGELGFERVLHGAAMLAVVAVQGFAGSKKRMGKNGRKGRYNGLILVFGG